MAETENIAKMAEKLSSELFSEFFWDSPGPKNINWACENTEHEKKTHPSDVVFSYKEPYENRKTYLNCDLKSYAKKTINSTSIRNAILSLNKAIECAQISSEWNKNYKTEKINHNIYGLLFIYNHDGEFDSDFKNMLTKATMEDCGLKGTNRVFILGPDDIVYLHNITNDLKRLRGDEVIGLRSTCSFYYPDLIGRKLHFTDTNAPATIEMLLAPYQIVKYKNKAGSNGYIIYYRRHGEKVEEFMYLFDYLLNYQVLQNADDIQIRLPYPDKHASALFESAKKEYAIMFENEEEFQERLGKISYSSITTVTKSYSDIEVGMFREE